MFFRLFSIEWTRLARRAILWITLGVCALYIGLSQSNFYTANRDELLSGDLKMPGLSFDLASSLDQIMLIALPFLLIISGIVMGSDYTQRTDQHWLRRASRPTSLLAKFSQLVLITFFLHLLTMLVGGGIGYYYKTFTYQAFSLANVNWGAAAAASFYMTLVTMPYLALMTLLAVLTRSTFVSVAAGFGIAQIFEFMLVGIFYNAAWSKWLPRNLYLRATFLLNSIGNRTVNPSIHLLDPTAAFFTAAVYTLVFLGAAVWLYKRQDLGR